MTNPDLGGFVGYVPFLRSIKIKGIVLPTKLVYQREGKKMTRAVETEKWLGAAPGRCPASPRRPCLHLVPRRWAGARCTAAHLRGTSCRQGRRGDAGEHCLAQACRQFPESCERPIHHAEAAVRPSVRQEEGMMLCGTGSPGRFPAGGWPPLAFPAPLPAVGEGLRGAFAPRLGAAWRGG